MGRAVRGGAAPSILTKSSGLRGAARFLVLPHGGHCRALSPQPGWGAGNKERNTLRGSPTDTGNPIPGRPFVLKRPPGKGMPFTSALAALARDRWLTASQGPRATAPHMLSYVCLPGDCLRGSQLCPPRPRQCLCSFCLLTALGPADQPGAPPPP